MVVIQQASFHPYSTRIRPRQNRLGPRTEKPQRGGVGCASAGPLAAPNLVFKTESSDLTMKEKIDFTSLRQWKSWLEADLAKLITLCGVCFVFSISCPTSNVTARLTKQH